jgi:hypothetical protein
MPRKDVKKQYTRVGGRTRGFKKIIKNNNILASTFRMLRIWLTEKKRTRLFLRTHRSAFGCEILRQISHEEDERK